MKKVRPQVTELAYFIDSAEEDCRAEVRLRVARDTIEVIDIVSLYYSDTQELCWRPATEQTKHVLQPFLQDLINSQSLLQEDILQFARSQRNR